MRINPKSSIPSEEHYYCISPITTSINRSGIQLDTNKTILHTGHLRKSEDEDFFEKFNQDDLSLLQNRQAILILDFTIETENQNPAGFYVHLNTLFIRYGITPSDVIVITGNVKVLEKYDEYKKTLPVEAENFHLFYYCIFPQFYCNQGKLAQTQPNIDVGLSPEPWEGIPKTWHTSFEDMLAYKKENVNEIVAFSCFVGRRGVRWRDDLYKKLVDADLWINNYCSYANHQQLLAEDLQVHIDENLTELQKRVLLHMNPPIFKNSWLHVPVETSYENSDIFLAAHEKAHKATSHCLPFVAIGGKNQLDVYRQIGYKTFDKYFDESYNEESDENRMDAVIKLLKQIEAIPDKLAWYESMRDVLEHNYHLSLELYSSDNDNVYFRKFLNDVNDIVRNIK